MSKFTQQVSNGAAGHHRSLTSKPASPSALPSWSLGVCTEGKATFRETVDWVGALYYMRGSSKRQKYRNRNVAMFGGWGVG